MAFFGGIIAKQLTQKPFFVFIKVIAVSLEKDD